MIPRGQRTIAPIFACLTAAASLAGQELPAFHAARPFNEQERWERHEDGVRVYINAPRAMVSDRRTLVIYATPNGNTIEQTLGCAPAAGLDWHFDIQHVAAQVRRLRELSVDDDVLLAVVQAPKLSWPAYCREQRRTHPQPSAEQSIAKLVASLTAELKATRVVLAAHSGGGSFIFALIDSAETIFDSIERIIFLDANYAYAEERRHGDKLLAWLAADDHRRLIVVAYDDRQIKLNGKPVVSPTGGTFRATERMRQRFVKDLSITQQHQLPFTVEEALAGRVMMLVHSNPENKILHTALVGEMNGLLHGLTLGRANENRWGRFGGPRAYDKWVQREPAIEPVLDHTRQPTLNLPPRAADAMTGSQFAARIEKLSRQDREAAILAEITKGNIPPLLRKLKPIYAEAADRSGTVHRATSFVTCDYLSVGSDVDFFRVPMTPQTAAKIARLADASLITKKISDDIFLQADLQLSPRPLTQDRDLAVTFYHHHRLIEEQRRGQPPGLLLAGIKKDVVLTPRLTERENRVAIYGWHYPEGRPIQPLYLGHVDWYVDYSHGVRLMSRQMLVDGQPADALDVLHDVELCGLVSDEGPIEVEYK